MKGTHARWPVLTALAALLYSGGHLLAGDLYDKEPAKAEPVALPKPAEVKALAVQPDKIALKPLDDAQQLIITATLDGGRLQDLTGDVKYDIADPKVARVASSGRIVPLANGATEITATFGDKVVKVPVTAASCDVN